MSDGSNVMKFTNSECIDYMSQKGVKVLTSVLVDFKEYSSINTLYSF